MSERSVRLYQSVCTVNTNNNDTYFLKDLKVKPSKLFLSRVHSGEHISSFISTHNDATETNRIFEVKCVAHLYINPQTT